ncbi:MAG: tetratricopeptide repeat protein [Planctomycetota bacterium]|jgi:tetratricopeptide (TPR) repeat protein
MMERKVFQTTAMLIIMTNVFAGCRPLEKPPTTQLDEEPPAQHPAAEITEADLVEDMVAARETYEKSLERLIEYYAETDNKLKLQRVRRDMRALIPIYGPPSRLVPDHFKANDTIPAADDLFSEAQAREPPSDRTLPRPSTVDRRRLQKYKRLIRDYPTSDKIDDAAFHAGLFLEEDRNYVAALYYYMSAFKWDPETVYPARFKAAFLLDEYLHQYDEAHKLYTEAIELEGSSGKYRQWKELAEERIREIEKLGEDN